MRSLIAMNEVGLLAALPSRVGAHRVPLAARHVPHVHRRRSLDLPGRGAATALEGRLRDKELPDLTELIREVDDLPVLYLGCLLHDIGKGLGGDHSPRGRNGREPVSNGWASTRSDRGPGGLPGGQQHLVHVVIVAQRRDLSDPKPRARGCRPACRGRSQAICGTALSVDGGGHPGVLEEAAWTDWKGDLLQELFERTAELLETGTDDTERARWSWWNDASRRRRQGAARGAVEALEGTPSRRSRPIST